MLKYLELVRESPQVLDGDTTCVSHVGVGVGRTLIIILRKACVWGQFLIFYKEIFKIILLYNSQDPELW